jgi:PPOX class probable F420-dependent enzyme
MSSITTDGGSTVAPRLHRYITLTAFTPDDEPISVTTWFAALEGRLYLPLPAQSRIVGAVRQSGRVTVLPSNRSGEARGLAIAGKARLVPQLETYEASHAIDQKYGVVAGMSHLMGEDQGLGGEVILEVMLDPGPGAEELLVEAPPSAGAPPIPPRALVIGAALVGIGVVALLTLRRKRG